MIVRMRIFGMFLAIVGLNYTQVQSSDLGNATQVYYAVLTIDESVFMEISKTLTTFSVDNDSLNALFNSLEWTTMCKTVSNGVQCMCLEKHIWSSQFCAATFHCCGNQSCTIPQGSQPMCYSETRVTISGSATLVNEVYSSSLANMNSQPYKDMSSQILNKIIPIYNTLAGFDSLSITYFRPGSLIVDFVVNVNSPITTDILFLRAEKMATTLNAGISLVTTGFVKIVAPLNPVSLKTTIFISCSTQDNATMTSVWNITKNGNIFGITNGTEAILTSTGNNATIQITTSEAWAGLISCVLQPTSTGNKVVILHQASSILDLALTPIISSATIPQFPRCNSNESSQSFQVVCTTPNGTEPYHITWSENVNLVLTYGSDIITTQGVASINCNSSKILPIVTCTFTNRLKQSTSATLQLNVIYKGEHYCHGVDDWPDTKANFTALLPCIGKVGQRSRYCMNGTSTLQEEVSSCVMLTLNNILVSTNDLGKGIGDVFKSAENIMQRLKDSTNGTQTLGTTADVNASVKIITNVANVANRTNITYRTSIVNDFVESASNILDTNNKHLWTQAVAVDYLSAVQSMVSKTNLTNANSTNIQAMACLPTTPCQTTVFNTSVSTENSDVKIIGFINLGKYLTQNYTENVINSIVVSASVVNPGKIFTINFALMTDRPPNYAMQCVSWNETKSDWSTNQCAWGGAMNPGKCDCKTTAISTRVAEYALPVSGSFAILMSRHPLPIPYMWELTLAGLVVSIASLTVCLVINICFWKSIINTNSSYLRHIAQTNICLCLLIADCCFLVNEFKTPSSWCPILVLLKHFGFLAVFFWMLALSIILLHQTIFVFHDMSKKTYLGISLFLGYGIPSFIAIGTFISYNSGAEDFYYSSETCWLIFTAVLHGSIHAFFIPVGIIVMFNMFSMLVVIMKILDSHKTANTSKKEPTFAQSILKPVVILTPIFGLTWVFGFALFTVDLTAGPLGYVINYCFIGLNAFQGLFIFLTSCLGDKMIRGILLQCVTKPSPPLRNTSTTNSTSSLKKK